MADACDNAKNDAKIFSVVESSGNKNSETLDAQVSEFCSFPLN
ncbi:hypothetical protein [Enterococcus sp. LJL90]